MKTCPLVVTLNLSLAMKRIVFSFVFFLTCLFGLAQAETIDSLKKKLAVAKEDYNGVMSFESLSYAFLSSQPDSALYYAQQGLALAQRIGSVSGEASCLIALGNVYFHFGDYTQSLEMYLQAVHKKETLKDENYAVVYFNMADVYTSQSDFGHALQYLHKAMKDDLRRKDSTGVLYDLFTLGAIYHRMRKADSSLHYSQLALDLGRRLGDESLSGAILNNFGAAYLEQKKYPQALQHYHASIKAGAEVDDQETLTEDYFGLAQAYKDLHRRDSSVYYAYKALGAAQDASYLKQLADISQFLADLFEGEKRFDSAYKYFRLSTTTKDSLYNVEQVKKFQTLKFQEQQRQQTVATAETQYHQRLRLYAVLVASLILLAIAVILWRNNKQKQKAYDLLQQQKQKTDDALQEVKNAQAQLIHAEKMASLGELTAGIAHEIQNPLNFVNNFSELSVELSNELKEEVENVDLPGKQKQALVDLANELSGNQQKIFHHGRRAGAIVKSMLQHSHRSKSEKQPVDINAFAAEYFTLSYHGFRAKHHGFETALQTAFDEAAGQVPVVRHDLGRVLINLFNNAFYAVQEKKEQLNGAFEPTVTVETKRGNDSIEIRVKDNGAGIPAETRNKIFQPFFTTKPTGQGIGLGLSLAYDIIKSHNGKIAVESEEGKGTTFFVTLPLA